MVDHHDEPGASPPPPEGQGNRIGEPAEGYGTAHTHPKPAPPPADNGSRYSVFPMVLGAAMVLVLVIAWVISTRPKDQGSAATTTTTTAAPAAEKPADAEPDSKALKADLDGLKTALKDLENRIKSLPPPPAPVDLEPLKTRVSDLAKETEALAALPKKLEDLDQRLSAFGQTLTTVHADLDKVKKAAEAAPAASATTTEAARPADEKTADAAVDQAAGLFKSGKYKDASDAFQKLTESSPEDARVWYFAALSRGSATNQWTGETVRLVEKGIALEKAGNPPSAKIDAALAGVNPSFKPWLDAFRKRAQ
jgi:TolA-binding protein